MCVAGVEAHCGSKILAGYKPPYTAPFVQRLLDEGRIAREGILDARAARAQWEQLLAGRDESALAVWTLLIFQSWHERWAA